MFADLDIFRMSAGLAQHASTRHGVLARNIANADTPNFKAQDTAPFSEIWQKNNQMRSTRPGHLGVSDTTVGAQVDHTAESSPNGNSVSLEDQMVKSAEVRQQHDLALSVFQSSLNLLRTTLGKR